MRRFRFMAGQFLKEPLWFRIMIITSFIAAVVFSSSYFKEKSFYDGLSKSAAAIIFASYFVKFRRNRSTAAILAACAILSIYLSLRAFIQ
ncbi:hypothetical protein V1498_07315 [Peribacillus sp. SCS-26]|uniref:hypothetical protein n=1 Tax=Paraperibacillus marinus TaxID=3115295 RepID=UPI00390672E7